MVEAGRVSVTSVPTLEVAGRVPLAEEADPVEDSEEITGEVPGAVGIGPVEDSEEINGEVPGAVGTGPVEDSEETTGEVPGVVETGTLHSVFVGVIVVVRVVGVNLVKFPTTIVTELVIVLVIGVHPLEDGADDGVNDDTGHPGPEGVIVVTEVVGT